MWSPGQRVGCATCPTEECLVRPPRVRLGDGPYTLVNYSLVKDAVDAAPSYLLLGHWGPHGETGDFTSQQSESGLIHKATLVKKLHSKMGYRNFSQNSGNSGFLRSPLEARHLGHTLLSSTFLVYKSPKRMKAFTFPLCFLRTANLSVFAFPWTSNAINPKSPKPCRPARNRCKTMC